MGYFMFFEGPTIDIWQLLWKNNVKNPNNFISRNLDKDENILNKYG